MIKSSVKVFQYAILADKLSGFNKSCQLLIDLPFFPRNFFLQLMTFLLLAFHSSHLSFIHFGKSRLCLSYSYHKSWAHIECFKPRSNRTENCIFTLLSFSAVAPSSGNTTKQNLLPE